MPITIHAGLGDANDNLQKQTTPWKLAIHESGLCDKACGDCQALACAIPCSECTCADEGVKQAPATTSFELISLLCFLHSGYRLQCGNSRTSHMPCKRQISHPMSLNIRQLSLKLAPLTATAHLFKACAPKLR